MRIVAAIVLFAAAGLSTASAQTVSAPTASAQQGAAPQVPWALDHGRAADAAAEAAEAAADARARAAAEAVADARAKAAAEAAGLAQDPGAPADSRVNGSIVISAVPPPTAEQQKADAAARAAWQARCRPTVIEDREGLRRTRYAEPDCDLSRFSTAGTP